MCQYKSLAAPRCSQVVCRNSSTLQFFAMVASHRLMDTGRLPAPVITLVPTHSHQGSSMIMSSEQKRVQFDFEIEFLNGGGLQGQGFRLDIEGDDIEDRALAQYIVRDLRLLMVGRVLIRNKSIITEPHKR